MLATDRWQWSDAAGTVGWANLEAVRKLIYDGRILIPDPAT